MWLAILSDQLPVVALVGHYPPNKLIGREPPLWRHVLRRSFATAPMREQYPMRYYPAVGPAIPHHEARSLTCYAPVRRSLRSCPQSALDLHVLSTPPAFVLSQDQTLQ